MKISKAEVQAYVNVKIFDDILREQALAYIAKYATSWEAIDQLIEMLATRDEVKTLKARIEDLGDELYECGEDYSRLENDFELEGARADEAEYKLEQLQSEKDELKARLKEGKR